MARSYDVSRRTALKLTGAAASATLLAGCGSSDGGDDGGGDGGNGDGAIEIEAGARIEFDGQTGGWAGLGPSAIEGETNPALALAEGETYEIGWSTGDSAQHNIAIHDDGGSVVNELATETTTDPGDDQWLEFEASSEMNTYICELHPNSMEGDIVIQ